MSEIAPKKIRKKIKNVPKWLKNRKKLRMSEMAQK